MKNDIKKLYRKDPKLAVQVAEALGYKINVKALKSKKSIDQVTNYLSKKFFNYINEVANNEGYFFKMSAGDFEKNLNNILAKGLKIK